MPVLQQGTDDDGAHWYSMPEAEGSLARLIVASSSFGEREALCETLLLQVGRGLQAIHDSGHIHRDVKPANILALKDSSFADGRRWVIADLGLVRRPVGESSHDLTGSASVLGTLGYIAPELHGDPREASPASDIYGLGRVFAWVLTGSTPILTDPLLPSGDWRAVVREFTNRDRDRRPQNIRDAQSRAGELLEPLPISSQAAFHVAVEAKSGALGANDPLWDEALLNAEDHDFMVDDLVRIQRDSVVAFARARPSEAAGLAERLARHLVDGDWGRRGFDGANTRLDWVLAVAETLADSGELGLLEDLCSEYVRAVSAWNRFAHNDRVGLWLRRLPEDRGATVARAIRNAGEETFFKTVFGSRDFASATLGSQLRS
jgi:serine/threonine-protein kinase